jgi:hypothetical protein
MNVTEVSWFLLFLNVENWHSIWLESTILAQHMFWTENFQNSTMYMLDAEAVNNGSKLHVLHVKSSKDITYCIASKVVKLGADWFSPGLNEVLIIFCFVKNRLTPNLE